MITQKLQTRRLASALVALATLSATAAPVSAILFRSFDSVPAGDSLTAADGAVGGVGTGGALGSVAPPGGGTSSFDNTASPGFGTEASTYGGTYRVGTSNLVGELGTSSLTNFTIAYAYKPDSPNQATANTSARQLRMYDATAGVTSLTISLSGRRQNINLTQYDPLALPTPTSTPYSFGSPPNTNAARALDGDPNTKTDGTGGSFNANAATEWVFFAMTYESMPDNKARVTEYGMAQSEANAAVPLVQVFQSALIDMSTNSHGTTFDVSNQILELGNALFTANFRPYDAFYDNLGVYPEALTSTALTTIGKAALTVPVGVPGDYNNNGVVDAADYLLWRKGVNPLANEVVSINSNLPDDYDAWRARFGNPAGSGSLLAGGAVPEPSSIGLLLIGMISAFSRRSRYAAFAKRIN